MTKRTLFFILFISLVLALLTLKLYGIHTKYPGVDETWTLTYGYDAVHGKLIENAKKDSFPPLYYLLSGIVLSIHNSALALRISTVIISIILLVVFFFFVKTFFSTNHALLFTFLLTLNPMSLIFAQHPRPYTLLMLFFVLSLWFCISIMRFNKKRDYIFLGLVYLVSLYTHYYTAFFIIIQVLFLLIFHYRTKRINLTLFFSTLTIVAILFSFWLPIFFTQYHSLISQEKISIDTLTLIEIPYPLYKMSLMADISSTLLTTIPLLFGVAILITILFLRGLLTLHKQDTLLSSFFAVNIIGFFFITIILGFFIPIYSFRYLSLLLPLFILYLGIGMDIKNTYLRNFLFGIIIISWILILIHYFSVSDFPLWRHDYAV